MENNNNKGSGLIDPNKANEKVKQESKKIYVKQDGLLEREEKKVLTEDGRELLV